MERGHGMKRNSSNTTSGAPRWTYIAGALVAVAGLIWGIVTHFLPKPQEPVPPPMQQAEAENGTAINASGNSRVTVGGSPSHPTPAITPEVDRPAAARDTMDSVARQHAKAGDGGVAINASNDSEVTAEPSKTP